MEGWITSDLLGNMWKKEVVAYFKVQSCLSVWGTEWKREESVKIVIVMMDIRTAHIANAGQQHGCLAQHLEIKTFHFKSVTMKQTYK